MRPFTLCVLLFICVARCCGAAAVADLRCEYLVNPIGLEATQPRLSWIITSRERGEIQTAYQILVASSRKLLEQDVGDVWDSGKVGSDATAQIEFSGKPLGSRETCFWKVRSWNGKSERSRWSAPAFWQMGLLQGTDWKAKWILPDPAAGLPTAHLVIHRAIYESTKSQNSADVTVALAEHVKDDRLTLVVNNDNLGKDPAENQIKRLRVDYEYGNQAATAEVNENETLTIPKQASAVPILRHGFELGRSVTHAVLYATALGLYEVHLNGQRVGDHVLAPDWTDYRRRVRYQAYDVTSLVHRGHNAIAALLANGWYSGHIGNGGFQFFGTAPSFCAQLEVTYADGTSEIIATDDAWRSRPSPIIASDFMLGEDYDARREINDWDLPGLDDGQWTPVKTRAQPLLLMESQVSEPVRDLMEIKPKSVAEVKPGHWVFDLGQNMVGVVRLQVSAPAGTEITLHHAEMLNPDGTIYTDNLRGAPSVDHYICKGSGTEVWRPRFTFHGFRYVELTGLTEKPQAGAVTGVVIGTDNPRAGEFACSDPRLNQLQSNIQWGQRGNYVSVPTDCPQRDERLGWMGDAQVFVRTATYNADVAAFFTKWMVDVDDGQAPGGAFTDVSPAVGHPQDNGVPGWGDAGVICPWTIYQVYGDKRILERNLPAMTKWVNYLRAHSNGLIRDKDRGNDYGDWLSVNADTPKDLIGTAYFAYVTHLLAEADLAVGRTNEAADYSSLFEQIKDAFNKRYVSSDGRISGDTQTCYDLALKFGLLPDKLRPNAAARLAKNVALHKDHLSTGFLGVSYLLPVLTDNGETSTANKLLLQDSYPSWLFSVKHGATTIWERWDGWTPEKGFQDPGMNSFNHYSLGSCGEYLFGYIGGIRPASPGYKDILIEPVLCDGLSWAKTSYNSIHGLIATSWKRSAHRLDLEVTVPPNTTATVCVPALDAKGVTESGKPLAQAKSIQYLRTDDAGVWLAIGSGAYKFAYAATL